MGWEIYSSISSLKRLENLITFDKHWLGWKRVDASQVNSRLNDLHISFGWFYESRSWN